MRKFFPVSLMAILAFGLTAASQTNDFMSDSGPGMTSATVSAIDAAKRFVATHQTSLTGKISVRVLIDTNGNVSGVENATGPGYVCPSVIRPDVIAAREAAANAARMVKFEPAKVGDQPMASAGWLYFEVGKPSTEISDENVVEKGYTVIGGVSSYKGPVGVADKTTAPTGRNEIGTGSDSASSLSGGVLNGKAKSVVKPSYPPAARAVRASGLVTVQVVVDEDGSMFSAEAVSGHPLLRATSRSAACGTSFSQTLLDGKPVKITGIITYNFIAPE